MKVSGWLNMGLAFFLGAQIVSRNAYPLSTEALKVQRKEVFEFTERPRLGRSGDKVTIEFAVKDFCDATVAIEDAGGRIVRHLASGVLGTNAPEPFQKGSLRQTLEWDGKDEVGRYVDDKAQLVVRVSLGLKPRMERTLFWSGQKLAGGMPVMRAAREGVYVHFPGHGNQLRLFDHEGAYLRTLYPFPAQDLEKIQGLPWKEFPPENRRLPSKLQHHDQDSLLPDEVIRTMTVHGNRIFLAGGMAMALAVDDSAGAELAGPQTRIEAAGGSVGSEKHYHPHAVAVSPGGNSLYLTSYSREWNKDGHAHVGWLHGVMKIERFSRQAEPVVFAGEMKAAGSDEAHFRMPADVACDAQGRVYVADYRNDRIQVFSAEGKLLKSIAARAPARLCLNPHNGELWVFSWPRVESYVYARDWNWSEEGKDRRKPSLTRCGPFEDPRPRGVWDLPVEPNFKQGAAADIDFHTPAPTVWLANDSSPSWKTAWEKINIRMLRLHEGKRDPEVIRDFEKEVRKAVVRSRPARFSRQRLFVNPATGMLYVGEPTYPTQVACKSHHELVKIDPESGRIELVQLPTDPEDLDFDWHGRAYLRTYNAVTRFDSGTWREIPFDYGDERTVFHGQGGGGEKPYKAISAIHLPSAIGGMFHLGGMGVSPQGDLVVSCINPNSFAADERKRTLTLQEKVAYRAPLYPGRFSGWEIHIFDIRGKLVQSDVLPGLYKTTETKIDRHRNVYALAAGAPYLDGVLYFNGRGCTLIKADPAKARALSVEAKIPLAGEVRPNRSLDLARPGFWVEDAEWLFGPVGAEGHNGSGGHCACYVHGTFDLDYFGRVFAPEVDRFRVVVLDANGNVMVRLGRCGNVDDGAPLVAEGGPPTPRAIGGDETAIMHCMNVAVHSDRRLFLADIGNQCIRSVRLTYHLEEKVALKDVPER